MRAIITKQNDDGTYNDVGMNNRYLSKPYSTERGLIRFAIPKFWTVHKVRLEIFGESIYGIPAKVIYVQNGTIVEK